MGRQAAVGGHHAPAVVEHPGPGAAGVDHRLDGEDHARLELGAGRCRASSWGPGAPRAWRCRWRGRRTPARPRSRPPSATVCTARPTSWRRLPGGQLVDPAHRLLGDPISFSASAEPPHGHGVGGVAVVALDDGPAVDGEDVALLQHVVARDAVDDHVVGRGADHGRESRGS